jgi:hypothetical protein
LGVDGQTEGLGRTLGDELGESFAERVVGLLDEIGHHRHTGKRIKHANGLRTLAREQECELHAMYPFKNVAT